MVARQNSCTSRLGAGGGGGCGVRGEENEEES